MEIKIRYTWKRGSDGNIIQRIVDLRSLEEKGLILDFSGYRLIAMDLYIGKNDVSGKEIFNNDILDWGDNFPSKVYYDSDECAFRIEELGIKEGEYTPRTHNMEASTTPPNIIGNVHINNQSQK